MKNKAELIRILTAGTKAVSIKRRLSKEVTFKMFGNSGIPVDRCSDLITNRAEIKDATDFELYKLAEVLNGYAVDNNFQPVNFKDYFVDSEIKKYNKTKHEQERLRFPLVFSMTQISDDQWIGSIDVKKLMELRDAQIIYYNENTQRTMEHVISGEKEYYRISLNKQAVNKIAEAYSNKSYIPNTLTLNISDESEADFYYDEESCKLVINEINHFDIIDGYHRYVAMSKLFSLNPEFNYKMELRIVNFNEQKARHFIFQEDQKTRMKKIDSESMNKNNIANRICTRLNEDSGFIYYGQIGLNNALVNSAYLSMAIQVVFGTKSMKQTANIKPLTDKIKAGMEECYKEEKWSKTFTYAAVFAFSKGVYNLKKIAAFEKKVVKEGMFARTDIFRQIDVKRMENLWS